MMQKGQVGARHLPDASTQRPVLGARLLLQDTDVIGIQQELHGA
jgi:hypothetical protein